MPVGNCTPASGDHRNGKFSQRLCQKIPNNATTIIEKSEKRMPSMNHVSVQSIDHTTFCARIDRQKSSQKVSLSDKIWRNAAPSVKLILQSSTAGIVALFAPGLSMTSTASRSLTCAGASSSANSNTEAKIGRAISTSARVSCSVPCFSSSIGITRIAITLVQFRRSSTTSSSRRMDGLRGRRGRGWSSGSLRKRAFGRFLKKRCGG